MDRNTSSPDFTLFEDRFEGYSREWMRKTWNVASYLGIDFCFEDLNVKVKNIESKNIHLKGFGRFWMKEGFFEKFLRLEDLKIVSNPLPEELRQDSTRFNLLVLLDLSAQLFQMLKQEVPEEHWDKDIFLFHLQQDNKTTFFIITKDLAESQRLLELLYQWKKLLNTHEIWKGWPLCSSGRYMVTSLPRHPGKILSDALRLGCKWMFLVGPGEDMAVKELAPKISRLGLDFTVFSGQSTGDGKCLMVDWEEYPDPQASDELDACRMKDSKGGMLFGVFNNILDSDIDVLKDHVDGYVFHEGNSEFVDEVKTPFLVMPHRLEFGELPPSIWLFIDKEDGLPSKERIVKTLMSRKAVGIFEDGKIVGPSNLVNLVKILLADKEYLRRHFGSYFSLSSKLDGMRLRISMENKLGEPINGTLRIRASPGIKVKSPGELAVHLYGGERKDVSLELSTTGELNGSYGLLLIEFSSGEKCWRDLCYIEVPPMVSTFPLLVSEKQLDIPVTIRNNTGVETVDLKVSASSENGKVFEEARRIQAPLRRMCKTSIPMSLDTGRYVLEFSCSSQRAICRLLVRDFKGNAAASTGDYDGDGLEEAILENELVVAKVISPGGRLLQYRLKDVEADLLFKLYPKKPSDFRVSGRKRGFYPFGGLEEFIQQPTVEGHENFKIRIVRKEGSSAIVSAEADMNGNVLKKTFRLFGGSPLLEVRYEADFVNPELNVIGVNPLIRLGNNVDSSHMIYYPSKNGILKERYRGKLYGKRLFLEEDWIACYDEQEKLGLIMAYDSKTPFLTHIWMNTPDNSESHYSYIEVQPWIRVNTETTTYFSYYLYGFKGSFEDALKSFKETFYMG